MKEWGPHQTREVCQDVVEQRFAAWDPEVMEKVALEYTSAFTAYQPGLLRTVEERV